MVVKGFEAITEYDEERTFAEQKAEGRAEGRVEGRAEGKVEGFLEAMTILVKDGMLTLAQAAAKSNMTVPEFEAKTGLKV